MSPYKIKQKWFSRHNGFIADIGSRLSDQQHKIFLMNTTMLRAIVLLLLALMAAEDAAFAQRRKKKKDAGENELTIYEVDTLILPVPLQRRIWHENKIDKAQQFADMADGVANNAIRIIGDDRGSVILTEAILHDIDQLQVMIENLQFPDLPKGDNTEMQTKIRYLNALYELLRHYQNDAHAEPVFYRKLVNNFRELVIARHEGRLMEYVHRHPDIYTMTNKDLLDGYPEAVDYVYSEMGRKEPVMMIRRLAEFAKYPYADATIAAAAKVVPNEVYSYASSSNYVLSNAIRRSKDPLVQTIVRISKESASPLKAMAFLSDVYHRRKTIAEIDQITANPDLFYKQLVRLKLENEKLGSSTLSSELQVRALKYVRDMNDLHDDPDAVRFRGIDGFTPEELYFMMVYGQDEIYTSSFLGTFKRMLERLDPTTTSYELLTRLHFDRFRTFIRMCAGYNTLNRFLDRMPQEKRTDLMKSFIANLDKGGNDDLEDAVDVADAFGSIQGEALSSFLQQEVTNNYELSYQQRSLKGMRVYALLATLFNGLKAGDNKEAMQLQSEVLDLPPINLVPYKNLVNDSGIVYQQFFFYGDEDGKSSYANFLGGFKDGKWKKTDSKYWTTLTSVTGRKIVIYANLPLTEPEDEEAQKQLSAHLATNHISPTIIVHRGHSYHLPTTLDHLNRNTRIVILGSCGGYHNLGAVLDSSPDAHIISSKQVGAMNVNEPIVKSINTMLLDGNSVDWISMWKELDVYFTTRMPSYKSTFSDYVPPHKNLGSIFIKAYRKLVVSDEADT